jgi:hypothetical protein
MSKIAISRVNDVITVSSKGRFKAVFSAKAYGELLSIIEFAMKHEPNVDVVEQNNAAAPAAEGVKRRRGRPPKDPKQVKDAKKPEPFIIKDADGKRIGPGEFVKRVIANSPGNGVKFNDLVTNLAQYARARNDEKRMKVAAKSVSFLIRNPKNKLAYDTDTGLVSFAAAA